MFDRSSPSSARLIRPAPFDFLRAALLGEVPGARDWVRRFQQLSGPVMAKGLEDTALYRFNRLIALNEVGSKPGLYTVDVATFHAANLERLAAEPRAMLASSTHDTKRGEDARARIAAISSDPEAWGRAVERWHATLARAQAPIDRNEEYFFYQLLLGVWPMDWRPTRVLENEDLAGLRGRVTEAMLKSVREASVNTRWVHGDPDYEAAFVAFVDRALDPGEGNEFLLAFRAYEAGIFEAGVDNALIQTALRLTVPGVPDLYQGAELWEQSLVDPDNRRPVDFAFRSRLLAEGANHDDRETGATKFALIARLLRYRAKKPELFDLSSYEPVSVAGQPRLLAFARRWRGDALLVMARLAGGAASVSVAPCDVIPGVIRSPGD